jgi:hypothetical protein
MLGLNAGCYHAVQSRSMRRYCTRFSFFAHAAFLRRPSIDGIIHGLGSVMFYAALRGSRIVRSGNTRISEGCVYSH